MWTILSLFRICNWCLNTMECYDCWSLNLPAAAPSPLRDEHFSRDTWAKHQHGVGEFVRLVQSEITPTYGSYNVVLPSSSHSHPPCVVFSTTTHERGNINLIRRQCEVPTRCIRVRFGTLLIRVVRYTANYGLVFIHYWDPGSVGWRPEDGTNYLTIHPCAMYTSQKCQLYSRQNWSFTTNELMTHN